MNKQNRAIQRIIRILLIFPLLFALIVSVPAQPARADTYVVSNTANSGPGSLRQAITDANNHPGPDLITFDPSTNEIPIVLSGAASEDANLSGDLDILNGGDLTIQGNGVLYTKIDGDDIDRIFHNCPGGGCAGTVTLMDMVIRNGTVTDGGGAIYNVATLNIQNCTVGDVPANGSVATWGGGIYNAAGTLTIDGGQVVYNDANYGGGIYNNVPGIVIIQNSSSIACNIATTDGGGIYNAFSTLTVTDSTVRSNDAVDGGGIYNLDEGVLNITNSIIGGPTAVQANTASDDGGGIYNIGTATIDSSTISSNTSTDAGAGIYNFDTLMVQNGSTIGGAGMGNIATGFGGGIYNANGTTTIDNSTVSANYGGHGGGIDNDATLIVQNGSTIGGAAAGNSALEGGGINTQTGAITTINASAVSANTAGSGGGIFSNATLIVQAGSTIGGSGASNSASYLGGGIYILAGTTTVDGSIVSGNIAPAGGGIYNTATLNVQNGAVIGGAGAGNLATAHGGGIYNEFGTTTVDSSAVSDNTAAADGGGIYNEATLNIQNGSTIGGAGIGNTAIHDGGGIYNEAVSTTVDGSTVSANIATNDGGGIYNRAVLTVQNGSTIGGRGAGNQAVFEGGGIYNDVPGTTMMTGSRLLDNSASTGGGVFNDRNGTSVTSVTGSCIVGNSAPALDNNQSPMQSATGDWWGAPTGPNTPGADTTGGNWVVTGYLSAPILGCGYEIYLPLIMR